MKVTIKQLRTILKEELIREDAATFSTALDDILDGLQGADKKIEAAHSQTSFPQAQAILVGLHQELFTQIAEFRKYIRQLKGMANKGSNTAQ
jgi:hypothetical protein